MAYQDPRLQNMLGLAAIGQQFAGVLNQQNKRKFINAFEAGDAEQLAQMKQSNPEIYAQAEKEYLQEDQLRYNKFIRDFQPHAVNANLAYQKGDYDGALKAVQSGYALFPDKGEIVEEDGLIYQKTKNGDKIKLGDTREQGIDRIVQKAMSVAVPQEASKLWVQNKMAETQSNMQAKAMPFVEVDKNGNVVQEIGRKEIVSNGVDKMLYYVNGEWTDEIPKPSEGNTILARETWQAQEAKKQGDRRLDQADTSLEYEGRRIGLDESKLGVNIDQFRQTQEFKERELGANILLKEKQIQADKETTAAKREKDYVTIGSNKYTTQEIAANITPVKEYLEDKGMDKVTNVQAEMFHQLSKGNKLQNAIKEALETLPEDTAREKIKTTLQAYGLGKVSDDITDDIIEEFGIKIKQPSEAGNKRRKDKNKK